MKKASCPTTHLVLCLFPRFDVLHLMQNPTLATAHIVCGFGTIETQRGWQRCGYHGATFAREFTCRAMKIFLCHSFGTIDAIAHLDAIEIHLHDTLLRPKKFDEHGEIDLKTFAHPGRSGPQEDIFGGLLRYGASPTTLLSIQSLAQGIANGFSVKSIMLHKTLVFATHHRTRQSRGDFREGDPIVLQTRYFSASHLLHTANHHERSEGYGHPTIDEGDQHTGRKEKKDSPAHNAPKHFERIDSHNRYKRLPPNSHLGFKQFSPNT